MLLPILEKNGAFLFIVMFIGRVFACSVQNLEEYEIVFIASAMIFHPLERRKVMFGAAYRIRIRGLVLMEMPVFCFVFGN